MLSPHGADLFSVPRLAPSTHALLLLLLPPIVQKSRMLTQIHFAAVQTMAKELASLRRARAAAEAKAAAECGEKKGFALQLAEAQGINHKLERQLETGKVITRS